MLKEETLRCNAEIRTCDKSMNFFDEFLFLLGLEAVVPLRQSGLASSILDEDELDRHLSA